MEGSDERKEREASRRERKEEDQGGGEKRRVRRGDRLKRNKWDERRGEVSLEQNTEDEICKNKRGRKEKGGGRVKGTAAKKLPRPAADVHN
jgi:hypothetical protein